METISEDDHSYQRRCAQNQTVTGGKACDSVSKRGGDLSGEERTVRSVFRGVDQTESSLKSGARTAAVESERRVQAMIIYRISD